MIALTSSEINNQLEIVNQAKQQLNEIICSVQRSCTHQHIAECKDLLNEPARVCLHCGIHEVGWGCGYIVLKNNTLMGLPTITSQQYYSLKQGIYINENVKGQLLRKEITLDVL